MEQNSLFIKSNELLLSDWNNKNIVHGPNCLEQFDKISNSLWAKSFSRLLLGKSDWSFKTAIIGCKLTSKKNIIIFCFINISDKQKNSLLPTVTTQETPHYYAKLTKSGRRETSNGNSHSLNLADYALRGMLPIPNKSECKLVCKESNSITLPINKSYQLNPQYILEMMGFPKNWVLNPFLNFKNI